MKRIFIAAVFAVVLLASWTAWNLRPVDPDATKKTLMTIESGQSVSAIASRLASERLIRSPLAFRIAACLLGASSGLRAGSFLLSPSQTTPEIISMLRSGKSEQISITVPEGFTVTDIDRLLASKGLGKDGDLLNCASRCDFSAFDFLPSPTPDARFDAYPGSRLEGYLFPETYFVEVGDYQPKFFLERLLGTFRKRIVTLFAAEAKEKGTSLADIVIMASLVEEESRKSSERPIVAGILWKRLKNNVLLGVDATLRYALQKPTGALTKADLALDSPYNTRTHRGLPPTPIANPGESAILAALRSEKSTYWYYLHGSDGEIHYAVTNDEHNVNRLKYLR
jgi:UPF0755 protein